MIVIRKTLLEYDSANDEAKRANALETIKKYCSYNHNHPKPNNLKKIKKTEENKGAVEDTSEEEEESLRQYSSEYDCEKKFTRDLMTNEMMKNNNQ